MRAFCRDLTHYIPGAVRVPRGKLNLYGVAEKAFEFGADRVVVVNRRSGGIGNIELFQVGSDGLISYSLTLDVASVRLRKERKRKQRQIKSLALTWPQRTPPEIVRISRSISNFFRIPISRFDEDMPKYQALMLVSQDRRYLAQIKFVLLPETEEVGPHITISQIR
jgi:rRNA maturation protein Rpf1